MPRSFGGGVELFAQDVQMAGVPGGLLDHVDVDPAQRHLAHLVVRHCGVEGVRGSQRSRQCAGGAIILDPRVDRLVVLENELGISLVGAPIVAGAAPKT